MPMKDSNQQSLCPQIGEIFVKLNEKYELLYELVTACTTSFDHCANWPKIILILKASYLSDIHNFVWSIPAPIRFLKLSALTLMPGTFDKSSVSLLGWSFWAILIEIPFSSAAVRKVIEL